jgi:hypothetical protein
MIWWYHQMNASIHPMVFQETYREVFTQKWLAPDEPILPSVHLTLKKDQMLGIFSESRREFHKLSNNYKVTQNGVRSKELWPIYRRAATCVTGWTSGTVGATSIIRCSKIGKILRIISFTMSISSSKTEFGAKRYGQNTEGYTAAQDDPILHKMTSSVHPTLYLN